MSLTYWGVEARVPYERLVSWMSSFTARRGERFGVVESMASSRNDDLVWQLGPGHAPEWSRGLTAACCYPELVTALSRELDATVITVSEQENSGMQCFCVVDRGEIRTLFCDGCEAAEEEGVDRAWVDRYLSSGLVRVPAGGVTSENVAMYIYPAFVHVGCDVDMKWVWEAWEDDAFSPTHVMSASSLGEPLRREPGARMARDDAARRSKQRKVARSALPRRA